MTSEQMNTMRPLGIFVSYYRPHMRLFLLDMVCALCIALVDLAFPYVSRRSMQTLLPDRLYAAFFAVIAALIIAYIIKAVMTYVVTAWGHLLGVRIEADMRRDLFHHMQRLSCAFYDQNRTGHLMSRVTSDLFEITELAHHGPEDLFISLVTLAGAIAIMFTIRWELALLLLILIPVFLLSIFLLRKRMMHASVEVKKKTAGINGEIESALSGIRTAKAFANEDLEIEKFARSNDQFRDAKREYYKSMGIFLSSLEFFMSILPVVVIAAGGALIMRNRMDYIDLITFSLYVTTFINPVRKLSSFSETFVQGLAGFRRFVTLMRTEPEIQDAPEARELTDVKGDVRIEDLSFRYTPESEWVLEHISLHIQPGETVAIVGPSGGGKSTLCQLIPRFYDVTEGRILLDGQDIRDLTQSSLHRHIGIVQQDVFLFADTIYENIRYGRPDATEPEIIEAARRAEIYDAILDMPGGLQTYVGERGVMLSGGQKQRISIARIFLKDPSILILDEATSALDSITEMKIQSAFDALSAGRTTLVIAHRLSTIRNASRILVVDGSRIVEQGTHAALLAQQGTYAKLYQTQQSLM
ncbi:MAG: ABC transporter ATP-binding protein/permease [Oscillospiraceae bacterium]|nr:ABC transporter ATP-binding protein/permease [Oscillospiraceae bacterium]